MKKIFAGGCELHTTDAVVEGDYVELDGEQYYCTDDVDAFREHPLGYVCRRYARNFKEVIKQ